MKSLVLVWAVLATRLVAAESVSPDLQARYLAGLPVAGTAIEPLALESAGKQHAAELGKAWASLEKRQLSKIAEWTPRIAPYAYEDTSPLFYLFSGPDFLYAHAYFPNAKTIVMCGIEPVGALPDVMSLTADQRATALRGLRNSLESALSFSFFRTKAMKTDFQSTALTGTLPVLYLFIAHAGCTINSVEKVWVDANGDVRREATKTSGARIDYTTPEGKAQTVYYFSSDLSNDGIKTNPGFIAFCGKQGIGNGFAKAASYLMHMGEFSQARDFLLTHSKAIVQDDSGIPYHLFKDAGWSVSLAGHYDGPISLFKENYQADLHEAIRSQPSIDLPFSAGYRWKPNESLLMLARTPQERTTAAGEDVPIPKATPVPKAVPVEEEGG